MFANSGSQVNHRPEALYVKGRPLALQEQVAFPIGV